MAAGTMVSRVLGMVRTSLLTAVVGLSLVADAFQVANNLPNYIFILLSSGILNAVLIPQITKAMRREDGGQAYVDRLITAALIAVVGVAAIATSLTVVLIRTTSDLSGAAYQLGVFFGYICLPQIAFYGLYAVLGQVLNARGQFASYMWAPVLANVIQIAGLVTFLFMWGKQENGEVWTSPMVWLLAGSSTLGIAVQGIVLIIPLWRGGFRWRPRFDLRGHGLGASSKILGWTFTAVVIAQLGGLFIQWTLTSIRDKSPNVVSVFAQQNAFLLFMLPTSFVTTSILTALYPQMSRAFQETALGRIRGLVKKAITMPAVLVIPMSLAMVALSYPIMRTIFPGLTHQNAVDQAWILAAMCLGVAAFGINTLSTRYCFAREDGRTNLWLQTLVTLIQIGFAVLAFKVPPQFAVVTIALGQTLSNVVVSIVFMFVVRRQLNGIGLRAIALLYMRLGLASALAGAVAFCVAQLVNLVSISYLYGVFALMAGGLAFVLVFIAISKMMAIAEVDEALSAVMRRLRPRRG